MVRLVLSRKWTNPPVVLAAKVLTVLGDSGVTTHRSMLPPAKTARLLAEMVPPAVCDTPLLAFSRTIWPGLLTALFSVMEPAVVRRSISAVAVTPLAPLAQA